MCIAPDKIDRHVGQKLREFREASGLSNAQLAQQLAHEADYVIEIEDGTRHLTAEELWDICIVLDVSPSAFFAEID